MNFLTRHLRESGESYFEHFLFAFSISMWMIVTSLVLLCHAIFPFSFIFSASSSVKKINQVMQKRIETLVSRRAKNQS
ncbi:MAG: hypothetical protein FJX34_06070 [Alphaproteobacteria bacterium]|nr:hypothetical protein [Alphaproteobacteria bacterium]